MNVDVTAKARDALKRVCERRKKVQRNVVAQLLKWFAEQNDIVQTVVLDEVDEGMEMMYADALEAIAKELRARARAELQNAPVENVNQRSRSPEPSGKT